MAIARRMSTAFRDKFLAAWDQKAMSMAALSRLSGVSYNAINKLKRGSSESTSAENAAMLAAALGFEWQSDTMPGLSEPSQKTYIARALAALDQDEPTDDPAKPFEIQFSQVDGVVKVAAVIRDPEGFTKLRATLDALEALNR